MRKYTIIEQNQKTGHIETLDSEIESRELADYIFDTAMADTNCKIKMIVTHANKKFNQYVTRQK